MSDVRSFREIIKTPAINISEGERQVAFSFRDKKISNLFSVKMGSTWRRRNPTFKRKSENADVFHAALHRNGLPMAAILDGCGRHAQNSEIQTIAGAVIETLAKLVDELDGKKEGDVEKLIKEKYRALDARLANRLGSDASVSAVALYRNHEGNLTMIGFGTGDTMVVLQEEYGYRTILAAKNKSKAPLPLPCPANVKGVTIDTVLKHLAIVHQSVDYSKKLVFLTDGAYAPLLTDLGYSESQSHNPAFDSDVVTTTIQGSDVSKMDGIMARAEQKVQEEFNGDKQPETVGDDAAVATLSIEAAVRAESSFKLENRTMASIARKVFAVEKLRIATLGTVSLIGSTMASLFVLKALAITIGVGAIFAVAGIAVGVGLLVAALVFAGFLLYANYKSKSEAPRAKHEPSLEFEMRDEGPIVESKNESKRGLEKEADDEVDLLDAAPRDAVSARALQQAGAFAPASVATAAEMIELEDDKGKLIVEKGKFESILAILNVQESKDRYSILLLLNACVASPKDRAFLVSLNHAELEKFKPAIMCDDEETRRIVLALVKKTPDGVKVSMPTATPVALAKM